MYWKYAVRTYSKARALADRHYSRKKVGAVEFCPPGHNIVLVGLNNDALWVSHRPAPNAKLERPRFDGFDCWDNPYFRNESNQDSSELIYDALAVTRHLWGLSPLDGFHTFIDPAKVKRTRWNGREQPYGFVYWLVGFTRGADTQKGLLRYVLTSGRLNAITPLEPVYEIPIYKQMPMNGMAEGIAL